VRVAGALLVRFVGILVLAILLAACGDSRPPGGETTGAPPSGHASTPSPSEPPSLLGSFDPAQYREVFDTRFRARDVADSDLRWYMGAYRDYAVRVQFLVDANDPARDILQSQMGFGIYRDDVAKAVREAWFDFTRTYQPEAVAWLKQQLTDYLEAPGRNTIVNESFGEVCAVFRAFESESYPSYPGEAVGLIIWSRDLDANCRALGATSARAEGPTTG